MGAGVLTNVGLSQFAAKQAANENLNIDRFLLANIPGLDTSLDADKDEVVPSLAYQVRTLAYTKNGYLGPNSVVYSLYLGTEEGDYTFNWVGLLDEDNNLIAVRYVDPITKKKTANGVLGDAITRNFLINYIDAQAITNITVEASAWQFDHSVASETQRGLIKLATQPLSDAGDDDETALTPLKAHTTFIPMFVELEEQIQAVNDSIPTLTEGNAVTIGQNGVDHTINVDTSDSVASNASNVAASSAAVKTAYDEAAAKVKDVRLGSLYSKSSNDNGSTYANSGGVMVGLKMGDGDDHVEGLHFRPLQVLIGSSWYTI